LTTYYVQDHLGSIVQVTSSSGTVSLARQYDPFGNLLSGASESGFAFTGREWDAESGLYYYRARYYDPKAGRFISADRLPYVDGPNNYSYVLNNPVNFLDPLGLQTHDSVTRTLQGAIRRGDVGEIENILSSAERVLSQELKDAARAAIQKFRSKAGDYIAQRCKGSINRKFPEELRNETLERIWRLAEQGDKAAQTARKLLSSTEYLK
jgi:RHS repeat-associated protein